MNCHQVHDEIASTLAKDDKPSDLLIEHMRTCPQCSELWEEQALEQWLPDALHVPIPVDLHKDIMSGVVASHSKKDASRYKWPSIGAIAASLLVMIFMDSFNGFKQGPKLQVVEVTTGKVEQVQLLVASAQNYQGANISVSMSEGMSLDAAGRVREVNWEAPLQKGQNLLALPIYLVHEDGGIVHVEFSSEEGSKQVQILVKAKSSNHDADTDKPATAI